ncbi:hypothetical protein K435DRAFT_757292 [Dendrothele bispora CBS 962.96]|uniref:Acyl-CoA oxidase C-alpha1 domain-containing protein n=1 Tax=Dendrothele bispora (strain CBS 962.96) TaxID=1314807 RepID=A0A4S8LW90_DENBC|nr:hypothetical protein K435DRAFT_757292 [Dendrothele bispora CBS 962.96]
MPRTSHLIDDPLYYSHLQEWKLYERTPKERAKLSFERSIAMGRANNLTLKDIVTLSPAFWNSHRDPILALDAAAGTLYTIHCNLALGTLCSYLPYCHDPELANLLKRMAKMEVNGQFCMTEIGHGLDAENMETRATWSLGKGHWVLHTPRPEAGKYMPPTTPYGDHGVPCVATVFAKMIVDEEDQGIRPFLVNIHDGKRMYEGVSTRLLPPREGSNPVLHSITYFENVKLPAGAMLEYPSQASESGPPSNSFEQSALNLRLTQSKLAFELAASRVSVGALALSLGAASAIKISANIGWLYSWRRLVGPVPGDKKVKSKSQIPIISFSTQQNPILTAVARAYVLDAFHDWVTEVFSGRDPYPTTLRIRHSLAAVSKAITIQFASHACYTISERCGAQGLFHVNMMSRMHSELRGIAIAEGDILGVAIRLVNELILNKYSLPKSRDPGSLLARHEQGLLDECREIMKASGPNHRSPLTNTYILPRCQKIVEAIGHRMAYDAAVESVKRQIHVGTTGIVIPECVIDLFEASIVRLDEGWYIENIPGFSRKMIEEKEVKALGGVMKIAGYLVERWGLVKGGYIKAPIASDKMWGNFVEGLEKFGGHTIE